MTRCGFRCPGDVDGRRRRQLPDVSDSGLSCVSCLQFSCSVLNELSSAEVCVWHGRRPPLKRDPAHPIRRMQFKRERRLRDTFCPCSLAERVSPYNVASTRQSAASKPADYKFNQWPRSSAPRSQMRSCGLSVCSQNLLTLVVGLFKR